MNFKDMILNYEPHDECEASDKEAMLSLINHYDDVLTRANMIGHFTASNWIVNKERTKVLMIHHNIYNAWAWTGGHADGDADLLHVAVKEANEETGIDVEKFKVLTPTPATIEILTVEPHIKRGKYVSSHLHLNCSFILEVDENEEIRIKEDENSAIKWINMDELETVGVEDKMVKTYTKLREISKTI